MITEGSAERFAAAITWTIAVLFFTTALVIAYVIPLHAQDALTFGEWSRLIAQDWHFHYPAATVQEYGRPLFYVLQGGLWGAIGVDDSSGRILSLLFSLLLFGSLVWLVREERDWGILAGLLAMLALLATPVFAFQIVAGLTDVPVAAFIAYMYPSASSEQPKTTPFATLVGPDGPPPFCDGSLGSILCHKI